MDPYQVIAEGGEALIAGWLGVTLSAGLRLPENLPSPKRSSGSAQAGESEDRREFLLAGAKAALEQLAPASAWLGERLQAVQFLCSHAAAMHWQASANSPVLGEPVRHRAQRFATQMMALTSRQLSTLAHLRDARRKEREAAERQAWRQEAHATKQQLARGSAFTAELEHMMKLGAERDAVPEAAAAPKAAGAGVPEPPPGPAPALNRRERRALKRLDRKQRRRAGAE
ncbi:MAG: hypothetical protein OEU09_08365 [Rhodospirillales bacterium]|nr:hypothetical protein [Rhodospirillales bacterium]MDH3792321.1 hypothetical protein [Rhodospirillales bacterium]MDH3911296.1 hypothetical protein [Rhodospirillales bacterium]MDH3917056.1 hypothetical protein [Rhodospirillales bacterium]MDH3969573.1 hypothetical protein [Rhodospirillales bacterium]